MSFSTQRSLIHDEHPIRALGLFTTQASVKFEDRSVFIAIIKLGIGFRDIAGYGTATTADRGTEFFLELSDGALPLLPLEVFRQQWQ